METQDIMFYTYADARHYFLPLIFWRRRLRRKQKVIRRFWVRPVNTEDGKQRVAWKNLVYEKEYLRMSPDRFEHLFSLVALLITKEYRKLSNSLLTFLIWQVVLSKYLIWVFVLGGPLLGKNQEVCAALYDILSLVYLRPTSTTKVWKTINKELLDLWDFPRVVGASDAKHITRDCPKNAWSQYFKYKEILLQLLLAVSNVKYKYTFINVPQFDGTNESLFKTEWACSFLFA